MTWRTAPFPSDAAMKPGHILENFGYLITTVRVYMFLDETYQARATTLTSTSAP